MGKSIEELQREYADLHRTVLALFAEPEGHSIHGAELARLQSREHLIVSQLRAAGAPIMRHEEMPRG